MVFFLVEDTHDFLPVTIFVNIVFSFQVGHYLGRTYSKERGSKYLIEPDCDFIEFKVLSPEKLKILDVSWEYSRSQRIIVLFTSLYSWCSAGWIGFEFCEELHQCHRNKRWALDFDENMETPHHIVRPVEGERLMWEQYLYLNRRGQTCSNIEAKGCLAGKGTWDDLDITNAFGGKAPHFSSLWLSSHTLN